MENDLRSRLLSTINVLGAMISHCPDPGTLHSLRRLDPKAPTGQVFWEFMQNHVPQDLRTSRTWESAWAAILQGMATLAPFPHIPGRSLGRALKAAGFTPTRLERLLRSDLHADPDVLTRICRRLAQLRISFDWADLIAMIFFNDDAAERDRRNIARSYYETPDRGA